MKDGCLIMSGIWWEPYTWRCIGLFIYLHCLGGFMMKDACQIVYGYLMEYALLDGPWLSNSTPRSFAMNSMIMSSSPFQL